MKMESCFEEMRNFDISENRDVYKFNGPRIRVHSNGNVEQLDWSKFLIPITAKYSAYIIHSYLKRRGSFQPFSEFDFPKLSFVLHQIPAVPYYQDYTF